MGPKPDSTPLVAIVGETASGKSALALRLAQRFNGEIVAADSRTIYRGMDIGTAKPTPQECSLVAHHLLDVVTPDQHFSAAEFKRMAESAIRDITSRGKLPVLVGGTGLYIEAVVYDFTFRQKGSEALRRRLEALDVESLQSILHEQSIPLPENERNPRHLIRAIETGGVSAKRHELPERTLLLGLRADRDTLQDRLSRRVDKMVAEGFIQEVEQVANQYGWDAPALQSPRYQAFRQYLQGDCTLDAAKKQFVQSDTQLAKRQRTWFKRNKGVHWISKEAEAVELITTLLSK
jgi:tRNA dimethylallyltransferase